MVLRKPVESPGPPLSVVPVSRAQPSARGSMLAVLVVQGLVTPAMVATARPLATAVAPRATVARLAPVHRSLHRSRCRTVRLQTEDDEASDGGSESPRRSAVLFRRLSDVLFLLTTIAIQAIGAASVIGGPARWKARPVRRPARTSLPTG